MLTWGAVSRFKAPSRSWVVRWRWERRNHQRSLTWWPPRPFCGGGPGGGGSAAPNLRETTGQSPGKPPKTAGGPLAKLSENRWKTAGGPLAKTVGKTAGNRRGKPRFWVTFASLNKSREGALRRHFSAPGGGVAIRSPLLRLNLCTLRSDGVGGTGICGFLDVTKGILGPMTPKSEFHDKATPKGVYTSSYTPRRGGAYPLVVKENSHVLA